MLLQLPQLVNHMLRTELQHLAQGLTVRLAGRLTGDDADHIRGLVTNLTLENALIIDLTEVTFVDSVGEATLSLLGRLGANFVANDTYIRSVCERLRLPLSRNGKRNKGNNHNGSGT